MTGPQLFTIHPHGSTDKLPYVTMGSGSLAAMAVFEAGWRPGLEVRLISPTNVTHVNQLHNPCSARKHWHSSRAQFPQVSSTILAQVQMSTRALSRHLRPRCCAILLSRMSVWRRNDATTSGVGRRRSRTRRYGSGLWKRRRFGQLAERQWTQARSFYIVTVNVSVLKFVPIVVITSGPYFYSICVPSSRVIMSCKSARKRSRDLRDATAPKRAAYL